MKYICSLVVVEDINVSRTFYEKVLRQKVKYDFGENISFESGLAIHLKSHFSKLIDGRTINKASHNFELYFEYDDLDSFVQELIDNNVEFVHEAKEQPWRQKVVRFYDPDKNIIEVGESLEYLSWRLSEEGKKVSEISKIIFMPEEFVIESLSKRKQNTNNQDARQSQ